MPTLPAKLNNEHASWFFPLNRGVRQGFSLLGLQLFVIGLELLARNETPNSSQN